MSLDLLEQKICDLEVNFKTVKNKLHELEANHTREIEANDTRESDVNIILKLSDVMVGCKYR